MTHNIGQYSQSTFHRVPWGLNAFFKSTKYMYTGWATSHAPSNILMRLKSWFGVLQRITFFLQYLRGFFSILCIAVGSTIELYMYDSNTLIFFSNQYLTKLFRIILFCISVLCWNFLFGGVKLRREESWCVVGEEEGQIAMWLLALLGGFCLGPMRERG